MLKKRIIPVLLWKEDSLVKGKNFLSSRRVGMLVPAIKIYNSRDIDELFFLNISATNNNSPPDENIVKQVASECSVPLTVGGGIKELYQAQYLLDSGADKICLNTIPFYNKSILPSIAKKFGSQAVVGSIDVKKIDGNYFCFSNSGKEKQNIHPVEWAKNLVAMGCGEILLTSIDHEGMMCGYDIEICREVSNSVRVPVVANGGAGSYDHMYKALVETKISAIAASNIFHYTDLTPLGAKKYLLNKGISIRK